MPCTCLNFDIAFSALKLPGSLMSLLAYFFVCLMALLICSSTISLNVNGSLLFKSYTPDNFFSRHKFGGK